MKLKIEIEVEDKIEAYQIVNKLNLKGAKILSSEYDTEKVTFSKTKKPKEFLKDYKDKIIKDKPKEMTAEELASHENLTD